MADTHAFCFEEELRIKSGALDDWVRNFCPRLLFLIDLQALFIGTVCGVVTLDVAVLLAKLMCFLARRDRLLLLFPVSSVNISDSSPSCAKTSRKDTPPAEKSGCFILHMCCQTLCLLWGTCTK